MAEREEVLGWAFLKLEHWLSSKDRQDASNPIWSGITKDNWKHMILRQCLDQDFLGDDFMAALRAKLIEFYEPSMNMGISTLSDNLNPETENYDEDRRYNEVFRYEDQDDYEMKLRLVKTLNNELRLLKAAIAHPETGEPCIAFAIASRDGKGRYTLENRITKKRSGSYISLCQLLPIKLVPDVPRKTRRDKKIAE